MPATRHVILPCSQHALTLLCCTVENLPHDAFGQLLRPGVVWFNESLDSGVLDKIEAVLNATDLFLVIGTSANVYPAAGYAPVVAGRGVPVVEINLELTGNSSVCTLTIQGKTGRLLPQLLGVTDEPDVAAAVTGGKQ
eukprot:GHRR01028159.1.p1 GENE.GHRR01028159.1~~GHRR01028159.1.p1  ORF type:complete len:138 (+),score=51.25 GHRR01028159.1:227-640(+)